MWCLFKRQHFEYPFFVFVPLCPIRGINGEARETNKIEMHHLEAISRAYRENEKNNPGHRLI